MFSLIHIGGCPQNITIVDNRQKVNLIKEFLNQAHGLRLRAWFLEIVIIIIIIIIIIAEPHKRV